MNNIHFSKLFFCMFLVLIFIAAPWLYSASEDGGRAVIENIGKKDPFEMIKPFSSRWIFRRSIALEPRVASSVRQ